MRHRALQISKALAGPEGKGADKRIWPTVPNLLLHRRLDNCLAAGSAI